MKTTIHHSWLWITLLLLFATLLSWGFYLNHNQHKKYKSHSKGHVPDSFMAQIQAKQFDKQGQLATRLVAKRAFHYADDDSMDLTEPESWRYSTEGSAWYMTAHYGRRYKDEHIDLWQNVRVRRSKSSVNQALALDTSYMHIFPDCHRANTDATVHLAQSSGSWVTSRGVQLDFSSNIVQLLHGVRGEYVPES